eukprot:Hpha_TRINITY_DN16221_c0_g4::TRINITY_DN16221_c0_g4_i1::g.12556::m.12556
MARAFSSRAPTTKGTPARCALCTHARNKPPSRPSPKVIATPSLLPGFAALSTAALRFAAHRAGTPDEPGFDKPLAAGADTGSSERRDGLRKFFEGGGGANSNKYSPTATKAPQANPARLGHDITPPTTNPRLEINKVQKL